MSYVIDAVEAVQNGKCSYCKFLSANDTGKTGAHQSGIYVSKPAVPILFDEPGVRGTNKDKFVEIKWMDGTTTSNRFIYYGQGTRNEYRITRFGRGFPYLKPEYIGSLFVLVEGQDGSYSAFLFDDDEDIQDFLNSLGISPTETNDLILLKDHPKKMTFDELLAFVSDYTDFPSAKTMSEKAWELVKKTNPRMHDPDEEVLALFDTEYKLYRAIEEKIYKPKILAGFHSVDDFEALAAQLMNRRKSRAGKSLENHLEQIFRSENLRFDTQVVTEENKTSDFMFPSSAAYHDPHFDSDKIIALGAKTTCKDRWRQVLNEANRVRDKRKFLCTLQQGVSATQLAEMDYEKLTLVVPKKYISDYPSEWQEKIWSLDRFISYVKETEKE